jgi:uncharacterized protein (DUF4415 family)
MPSQQKKASVVIPSPEEDQAINVAAKSDPDAQPLTHQQLQAMVPLRSLRGRPKSPHTKQLASIRYSPEVLNYFKSFGVGWQARMNAALKEYITNHPLFDREEA